jgi:hypothetical protein
MRDEGRVGEGEKGRRGEKSLLKLIAIKET